MLGGKNEEMVLWFNSGMDIHISFWNAPNVLLPDNFPVCPVGRCNPVSHILSFIYTEFIHKILVLRNAGSKGKLLI